MQGSRKTWGARAAVVAALTTGVALAVSGPATADNIVDTIEDNGAGLTLTAGSATGAIGQIKLQDNANGDSDLGCNIDSGEAPLVVDVVTPTGVTANPDPLTITDCSTFYAVTFTADANAVSGEATITIVSVPAGGGEFRNNVHIPITIVQPDPQLPGDDEPPAPADTTAPVIDYTLSPAAPDGDNGWYVGNVVLDWTVTEPDSPESLVTDGCDDLTVSADQAATTYTCSADSDGGHAEQSVTIKRDGTAPTGITFSGLPTAPLYFGGSVGPFGCTADDATSGLADCSVTGGGTTVGTHTLTATARDNAGNTSTATTTYTVLPWTLKGFYAPVDMNGVLNTVKGGSTVPLKFELFAGATELTDTAAVKSFTATKITCDNTADIDAIELTTTGSTSLRYDATGGQFIQNWKVPTGAGSCYRVTMTAQDGSSIWALFKAK